MTLKTYLQQGCSQNRTAELLHVHLNSLKYRLRRIVELTELNLHDSEELLYLQLSMRISTKTSIESGDSTRAVMRCEDLKARDYNTQNCHVDSQERV